VSPARSSPPRIDILGYARPSCLGCLLGLSEHRSGYRVASTEYPVKSGFPPALRFARLGWTILSG